MRKWRVCSLRKSNVITTVGIISAGLILGYLLSDKENRNRPKNRFNDYKKIVLRKSDYEQYSTLEEAGIPDQLDRTDPAQIENSKMVSEGSQYGVHYYNLFQEDENRNIKH